jgi:ATP-binding cassette subfamily B protein
MELGSNFSQVLNGVKNAKNILDIPAYAQGNIVFPKDKDIEFKNVSFSYDRKNESLKNVNFHIKSGEKIALVGKSGAGKSTITQLIGRFFEVEKGEVLIGGENIKTIDYEVLLENISIVFQNTFLSKESVLENIKMGTTATLEDVKEAAKKAQIHDFIMRLPEGYDTKVGGYGSRFSGGEKQRIAIARAILKNAPILILDEATSAADPENQYEINKAIENLCIDKTVIIVAHRLNIIKNCDRVAVVEDNTIHNIGTHEELLKVNQYYKRIWDAYEKAKNIEYSLKAGV